MLRRNIHRFLLSVVGGVMFCAGCGSSSHTDTLSAAQAQAVSQQVVQAVTQAIANALAANLPLAEQPAPRLAGLLGGIHPDQMLNCTSSATGLSCLVPLSSTGPCTKGGTISVSGDIQGTLNDSGSGSLGTKLTITPSNCVVSNVTFNGDPDISIAGQINFTSMGPSFPISLMEGGGISFGPSPSGSCQLNVAYTINSLASCTVTGSVCGQSVNGNC